MRELTIRECDNVAGGIENIFVYGTYTGGATWCEPGWAQSYISTYNEYNAANCTGSAYVDWYGGGVGYYYDYTTQSIITVVDSIPDLKTVMQTATVAWHIGEQVIMVSHISGTTANTTVQIAMNDINGWRQQEGQGHVPHSQGSAINWTALEINWDLYGADDPNLTDEDVFINFAKAAMQAP